MCSRFSNYPNIFLYGAITGTIFLILVLEYGPLEVVFVLALFVVVLYSIIFFIREEKRLHGALSTVVSKLCMFSNEYIRKKCCDYDVESENCKDLVEKNDTVDDCSCIENKPKTAHCAKDLARSCYIDIDKALEERTKICCRSNSVCQRADSESKAKKAVRELSSLNIECLRYAKYDCCSGCDMTCTFRQKRLEIYKLIQTLIDLDHQCSCPESVEFLNDLKQFVSRNDENKTPMQWWNEYQTLKIPPSCCNLNWYMKLERSGHHGVICSMHKNPNCSQEEKPHMVNSDNEKLGSKISEKKTHKVKNDRRNTKRLNWFNRRLPKKKKSYTTQKKSQEN